MAVRVTMQLPEDPRVVRAAVLGLALVNLALLQTHPRLPSLYASGVRYRREPRGKEDWQPITLLYKRGYGDCEDLAAARVAELVHCGEPATIHVKIAGPGLMHIQVKRADGSIEDPSKRLGM